MLKALLANIDMLITKLEHLLKQLESLQWSALIQSKTMLLRLGLRAGFRCCGEGFALHHPLGHRGESLRALINDADLAAIGVQGHLRET